MNKPGVSVVICTFNGAGKLPETIKHIALQKVPPHIPWEIVIVDNASTDGTAAIAHDEWKKFVCQTEFNIVHEPQPGLSYARTKGFASAQYDYVLLCDDDNWLDENYVALVFEIMTTNKNIGALGGKGKLVFEEDPPDWIKAYSVYAGGAQSVKSGIVERNIVYGAGCVIRKSAYDLIHNAGFRSLLTDRLGKELSSGGDYELCYALVMAGFDVWYDERLTFKHFITKERITREYYLKYLKESSKCFEVLEPYKMICEQKFISYRSFRYMMLRIVFYFLRKYVEINFYRIFSKKDSVEDIILSLQAYSVYSKILLFLKNGKDIYKNYKHGKAFQQKFSNSKSPLKNFFSASKASLFSITKFL